MPVAILARTSTLQLQDPMASLSRQIRSCQAWLPPGWYVAAHYWDIESGGLDLEQRSQGDGYRQFADAGLPRDGGLADLLAEARAPVPRFAAVVCEDIERSARDTFNALKLEKALSREGIPLFATDEPAAIEGANATTVLVRRVKQGVAEWYRIQLKEKCWKGLQEHSLAGYNIGTPPYGYAADRTAHPAPAKAAQGRTKTRLILDPGRAPVVEQIYTWRTTGRLSIAAIVTRLNASPAAYPAPGGQDAWNKAGVTKILANPKYTGHMVFGRRRKTPDGRTRPLPADQWLWTPEPVHPAIITRDTWELAQRTGAERGNVQDPGMPTGRQGRRYLLRSMIRCRACQRRMCGRWRSSSTGAVYVYYRCPHDPGNARHLAAHPDHGPVSVREDHMIGALTRFLDQYVFGYDRAALLADLLPATDADRADRSTREAARLRTDLARIDTAERALITELEQPADPGDPAAQAYRARIRERFTELYAQRTTTETQLAALQAAAPDEADPALLDALPYAAGIFADAPARIQQALLAALQVQALYNNEDHQVTIRATLTSDTPRAIAALIADPRTDDDTPADPPASTDAFSHSGSTPKVEVTLHVVGQDAFMRGRRGRGAGFPRCRGRGRPGPGRGCAAHP
ncbi:MAG: recombinase family protein [Streptosporangiaceae bacterium]